MLAPSHYATRRTPSRPFERRSAPSQPNAHLHFVPRETYYEALKARPRVSGKQAYKMQVSREAASLSKRQRSGKMTFH